MGGTKAKIPPKPPATFGDYLIACMDARGLDGATLSRLTGPAKPVDSSTISNLRNNRVDPGIKVLRRLAPHLGKSLGELLVAAGLATPGELGMVGPALPPVLEMVMDRLNDPGLSDRERRALLNHLGRGIPPLIEQFDDMLEEIANMPREPQMRRRS